MLWQFELKTDSGGQQSLYLINKYTKNIRLQWFIRDKDNQISSPRCESKEKRNFFSSLVEMVH